MICLSLCYVSWNVAFCFAKDVRHESTNFVVLYACVAVVVLLLIFLVIVGGVSYEGRRLPPPSGNSSNALFSRANTNPGYHQATSHQGIYYILAQCKKIA